jgi:cysteine desulfurase
MIYLDHAAATPMDPMVITAMQPYFIEQFYNPSANYLAARKTRDALNEARTIVAHWLGSRPSEIIFTAGGTEADNLAVTGIMQQYPSANILVSAIEHDAVRMPARQFDQRVVRPDIQGIVTPDAVLASVDEHTVLVSIMYANNEVGTIQPIRQIGMGLELIRVARRKAGNTLPLYFHTDACQAANYLDLHAVGMGVDMMTLNGGKIYGPKQSGILYVASHVKLLPIIRGGGQERNLRSGTENVAASVGFAQALELVQHKRHDEGHRLSNIRASFCKQLKTALPEAIINGSMKRRLPNNIHLTIPGHDNERLLIELEKLDIIAAAGSACSASSDEPSHVLKAMGISDADAQSSLRFTMGKTTSELDIRYVVDGLSRLIHT